MAWTTICGALWVAGVIFGIALMRAAAKPMPAAWEVGTKTDREDRESTRPLVSTVFDHQTAND